MISSHNVFDAYLSHRLGQRPDPKKRIYPSFRTTGGQIIPPEDVKDISSPIFVEANRQWAGRQVTQLKRGDETEFYTGKNKNLLN